MTKIFKECLSFTGYIVSGLAIGAAVAYVATILTPIVHSL
jgi:hypothetical protein